MPASTTQKNAKKNIEFVTNYIGHSKYIPLGSTIRELCKKYEVPNYDDAGSHIVSDMTQYISNAFLNKRGPFFTRLVKLGHSRAPFAYPKEDHDKNIRFIDDIVKNWPKKKPLSTYVDLFKPKLNEEKKDDPVVITSKLIGPIGDFGFKIKDFQDKFNQIKPDDRITISTIANNFKVDREWIEATMKSKSFEPRDVPDENMNRVAGLFGEQARIVLQDHPAIKNYHKHLEMTQNWCDKYEKIKTATTLSKRDLVIDLIVSSPGAQKIFNRETMKRSNVESLITILEHLHITVVYHTLHTSGVLELMQTVEVE